MTSEIENDVVMDEKMVKTHGDNNLLARTGERSHRTFAKRVDKLLNRLRVKAPKARGTFKTERNIDMNTQVTKVFRSDIQNMK